MKLREIIIMIIVILFLLLSAGLILGFFYQDVSDNYEDILSLSTESHRGDQISTKDLMVRFKNGRDQISFLRLSNDHRPYLLTIPEGLDYRSWGITIIGHFENVVGKDSYLTYDPFPHTLLTWWKKYFNFLLDPSSFYFDSQNTACRRFNDEKRCFFNGKLKERILRVVSDPSNVYVVQID